MPGTPFESVPTKEEPRLTAQRGAPCGMIFSPMEIRLVKEPIPLSEVVALAQRQFGELIKAAVDVERKVLAVGGELHSDEEALLIEDGSRQEDVWGINIYPQRSEEERVEFDSLINVRPSQHNRSRGVENAEIRARILRIVADLLRP